jgi:hypothetical protein
MNNDCPLISSTDLLEKVPIPCSCATKVFPTPGVAVVVIFDLSMK